MEVYECQLTPTGRVHQEERLHEEINPREDSVLIVDLGPIEPAEPPRYRTLGVAIESRDRDIIVL